MRNARRVKRSVFNIVGSTIVFRLLGDLARLGRSHGDSISVSILRMPYQISRGAGFRPDFASRHVVDYHALVRCATAFIVGLTLASALVPSATANGGLLVYGERTGGYDVSISVRPPKPGVGAFMFVVLVQAVAFTNGGGEVQLLPIATDLTFRGEGPDGATVGPLSPNTILAGVSHFDVRVPIEGAGEWIFTFVVSGPLGDVTAEVPLNIAPANTAFTVWLIASGATASVLTVILGLALVARRRSHSNLIPDTCDPKPDTPS